MPSRKVCCWFLRLPWAIHLEHFLFGRARFLSSIGFLGDLLWDNPFSGQGQDLSSFDPTEMHTTYRRYVVHKASLYSTLQSLFEHFFFLVVN